MSRFDPAGRPYRFLVLIFVSLVMYGSYFAYDSVGAIEDVLMRSLRIGQSEIGWMYSMYSVAAIATLFFAGMAIDRLGTRASCVLFAIVVTLGAAMVAAFRDNLGFLYAGRFVFGAGSEALIVAQNAILVRWFQGKELALAFGVALTISRLGTLFTFNTEALVAQRAGPGTALWLAAGLCLFSTVAALVYVVLDRRAAGALHLAEESAGDRLVLSQVGRFGRSFWLVTLLCVTFYSAIFPFTALSTNFFHEKYDLPLSAGSEEGFLASVFTNLLHMFSTAPGTTSIITFASMVFAPFAGRMVDRAGRRASLMILGSLLMIPCYLLLAFTHLTPIVPMVLLGAAFVLVPAAMWPSIAFVVPKERIGTAYALMTLVQNVGLMTFPYLNGKLREATESYTSSMVMFASLGAAGLVFALLLRREDAARGGVLERP